MACSDCCDCQEVFSRQVKCEGCGEVGCSVCLRLTESCNLIYHILCFNCSRAAARLELRDRILGRIGGRALPAVSEEAEASSQSTHTSESEDEIVWAQ